MLEQFGKMEFTPAHRGSAPQCHTFMSASCLVMASREKKRIAPHICVQVDKIPLNRIMFFF